MSENVKLNEINTESDGIDDLLSDCESSVGSLTMTTTRRTGERTYPRGASGDEQQCDLNLIKHSNSNNTSSWDNWKLYQNEYCQLFKIVETVVENYNIYLNKNSSNLTLSNLKELIPKHALSTFEKYYDNLLHDDKNLKTSNSKYNSFYYKIWKKHYCTLLDAIDLIYKDLQTMKKHLSTPKTEFESENNLDEEIKNLIESDSLSESAFVKSEVGYSVSCSYLTDLISQCRIFRGELERQNAIKDRLFHILKTAKDQRGKLKSYVSNLRNDLRHLLVKMRQLQNPDDSKCQSNDKSMKSVNDNSIYEKRIDDLEKILREEEIRRKKLHNKLQELIGNIRVYCRIRPDKKSFLKISSEDKVIVMNDNLPDRVSKNWHGETRKCYIFDRVFGPEATQESVFESIEELITSCVDGYNVCIMAYGQTGSGKTHTMMGTSAYPGVNRRAVNRLLEICNNRQHWQYRLWVSMVEVYQEEVRDLLGDGTQVRLMTNKDDEVTLQGLSEHEVKTEQDILRYFHRGESGRTVGSTLLNAASSRSHLVVLLKVYGRHNQSQSVGTLTLCDLAGSENVSKSGASGHRFCEAACINRSLSALARVFDSLRRRQKPAYRDTKLTHLLKPTLGGDSKCLLFVNVRCEPENAEETLRAIHFGINAMQVAPEKAQQRSRFRQNLGKLCL